MSAHSPSPAGTPAAAPGTEALRLPVLDLPFLADKPAIAKPVSGGSVRFALWDDGELTFYWPDGEIRALQVDDTRRLLAYLERLATTSGETA